MTDALEDIFGEDERKKETVLLYPALCPGYVWQGRVHQVPVILPHEYYSTIKPEDRGKDYVCEYCAEHYRSDHNIKKHLEDEK